MRKWTAPQLCHRARMAYWRGSFTVAVVTFTTAFVGCNRIHPNEEVNPQVEQPFQLHFKKVLPAIINDETSTLECVFPVENQSDKTVKFKEIHKSCSCTEAEIDSFTLEPGSVTKLRLRTNLGTRTGLQRLTCILDEEDIGRQWVFETETTIYLRAHFPERSVVHYGMISPLSESVQTIEFRCHGRTKQELPGSITFEVGTPHVSVIAGQGSVEQNQDGIYVRKIPLKLRLNAPADAGSGSTVLTAKYNRKGKPESVTITVDWFVRPFISAHPSQVYFDTLDRTTSRSVERRVLLKQVDGKPLSIKSVTLPHEAIAYEIKPTQDGTSLIVFSIDPSKVGEFLTGDVIVEMDNSLQQKLRLPVAVAPK